MNLPNKLTLLRVVLVPVFIAFMSINAKWATIVGLVIFAAASLTDMLDGQIARSQNLVTTFGKFADPLADKMLTTAAFLVFMERGYLHYGVWALFIILAREFAVSGIRLLAAADGTVIAAGFWGKFKTVMQMVSIIAGLLMMCILPDDVTKNITSILVWISILFTVLSGIEYIVINRKLLSFK